MTTKKQAQPPEDWESMEKSIGGDDEATNPMKAMDSENFSWGSLAAKEEAKMTATTTTSSPVASEFDDRMAQHFSERMKRMSEDSGDEKPMPHDTASGLSAVDDAMKMIAKSSAQSSAAMGRVGEHDNLESDSNNH